MSESISPPASSSAATTPTAFCASLAPWLKAKAAEVTHWAPLTGPLIRMVARRASRRSVRITITAASPPSTGEIASATRVPTTPTGCSPSKPPQSTASAPPSANAAPTSPPTRAWPEEDGRPRRQVIRFHVTAAARPAPITAVASVGETVTMPPIVSATAAPTNSGPSRLKKVASRIACFGRAARVATRAAIALAAS